MVRTVLTCVSELLRVSQEGRFSKIPISSSSTQRIQSFSVDQCSGAAPLRELAVRRGGPTVGSGTAARRREEEV